MLNYSYFQQKLREMDEQQCQVFSGRAWSPRRDLPRYSFLASYSLTHTRTPTHPHTGDLPAFKQRTDDAWSRHTHALRVAKARYDHRKAQLEREYEAAVLAANGQHCDERWHLRRAHVEECERKRVQLEVEMKGEEGGVVVMDANAHVPDVNGADVDKNNGDNDGIGAASAAMVTSSPRPLTADQIDADLFRMNAMVAVADALLLPNGDLLPGYTTPATVIDPKTRQLLASPQFYPTPPSIMAIAPPLPFTVGSRRSSTQQRYSGAEAARTSLPHGQTLVPASAAKSIAPSTRILADLGAEGQEASRLLVTIARSDAEMEARRLRTRVVTVGRGGSGDDAAVASTTPARKKMRVEQTVQRAEGEDVSALFEATAGANATTKEVTATSS